jgi:hypothetical protein
MPLLGTENAISVSKWAQRACPVSQELWLGEGNARFQDVWVEILAVPTQKRFFQVEERKRATPGTPSNLEPDGEGPQGTEGWGSQGGLPLDS